MTNQIRSYDDLLKEEQRLRQLKEVQAEIITLDYHQWKEKLSPVSGVLGAVKKFGTRAEGGFLLSQPLQLLVRRFTKFLLPKKMGWLMRWMIPILVRNFYSHKINEWGDQLMVKVKEWRAEQKAKKKYKKAHKAANDIE